LPPASGAASEPVQGRETILLVEDEPPVRQITVRLLKALGYRVLEAACGEDALRLMEAGGQKVELLMTDVLMPGMSGGELARALRGRHPP
jgi:CheY-like chemotaxis protein